MSDPDDRKRMLAAVSARLVDMAGAMMCEAETATETIRSLTAQAREVARLALELEEAAEAMDASARAQKETLVEAQRSLAENNPMIQALAQSIETVTSISGLLAKIAADSRLLSLNARIEASRAGSAGAPFAVVAREMSVLAGQTKAATDEIGGRAQTVARDVDAARRVVRVGSSLIATYDTMVGSASAASERQRAVAAAMTGVTRDTAGRIDEAAAAVGRVGSTAVAVKLLAGQVGRMVG